MVIRIVKYIFILILLFFIGCKSTENIMYMTKNSITRSVIKEIESEDKIDHAKTFQINLVLKNSEDCIIINMSSQIFDEIIDKNVYLKIYFNVEKYLDIGKFPGLNNTIQYSEIGRNYDFSWNTKEQIEICSSENPIFSLNKGDNIRIRFTTFDKRYFQYKITVFSDNGVNFLKIESL